MMAIPATKPMNFVTIIICFFLPRRRIYQSRFEWQAFHHQHDHVPSMKSIIGCKPLAQFSGGTLQYIARVACEGIASPYRERGRALFQARTPLTLVLSPQMRGEAEEVRAIRFGSRNDNQRTLPSERFSWP